MGVLAGVVVITAVVLYFMLRTSKSSTIQCYSTPGADRPSGYVWVSGIDELRMKTIDDIKKAHMNKEFEIRHDNATIDDGKDTFSAGYNYVAITVTERDCSKYMCFGKSLPTINVKKENEKFCSIERMTALDINSLV